LDDLFLPISLPTGVTEEFSATGDDLAQTGRIPRDGNAASTAELEDSLISQLSERSEHRVLIHTHHRGKVSSRRQSFPGLGLAIGNGAS